MGRARTRSLGRVGQPLRRAASIGAVFGLLLTGCGSSTTSLPVTPPSGGTGTAQVTLTFPLSPATRPSAGGDLLVGASRDAVGGSYVSPKTKAVGLFVTSVNGAAPSPAIFTYLDVGTGTPGCTVSGTSLACTISLSVPSGNDVFSIRTYAQPQASGVGNPISVGTATTTVVAGAKIDLPVALRAVCSSYAYGFTPNSGPIGQPLDCVLSATCRDSAGDVIGGTDPYYLPLEVSTRDTSGHVTSTPGLPAKLTAPGQTLTLHYDGLGTASTFTLELKADGDAITAGQGATSGAISFVGGGRHLYVVMENARAIAVYDIAPDGTLSGPSRTISGNKTGMTQPISVAVDALGAVYVVNLFGPEKFLVFAPGAHGNVAPQTSFPASRVPFSVASNGSSGYALISWDTLDDPSGALVSLGSIYSAAPPPGSPISSEQPFKVPNAHAMATSPLGNVAGYSVWTCFAQSSPTSNGSVLCYGNPIGVDNFGYGYPTDHGAFSIPATPAALVFRSDGALVVANGAAYMRDPNVTTYALPGAGSTTPPAQSLSILTGAETGFRSPVGLAYDAVSDSIYVSDTGLASYQGSIKVWPANATGNVAPSQTIGGLDHPFGIAVGP